MKKMIFAFAIVLGSSFALAVKTDVLDGKSYCRTIESDGAFGQPKGTRLHCISFRNGMATDNANTFFGNPPENAPYKVKGLKVTFGKYTYALSTDGSALISVKGSTVKGTVLTLKPN